MDQTLTPRSPDDPGPPLDHRSESTALDVRDVIMFVVRSGRDPNGLARETILDRAGAYGYARESTDREIDYLFRSGEIYGVPQADDEPRRWFPTDLDHSDVVEEFIR